jgi:uncharacterized protein Usg
VASVRGIAKVRDEAHIIKDTLDNWAEFCDQGIHIYLDCCTDGTEEICRDHPAVVEVLSSDLMDPDRERAEWFNRQAVLASAQRFTTPDDWIVYFDGDEHVEEFDANVLDDPEVKMVALMSYDVYITAEDVHLSEYEYAARRWVGQEWELAPYFYRCNQPLRFWQPDQRNIYLQPGSMVIVAGKLRHWGKGLSVDRWEKKCDYYGNVFGPKYAEKWNNRHGKAVHDKSDFGSPLILWEDVLSDRIVGYPRRTAEGRMLRELPRVS